MQTETPASVFWSGSGGSRGGFGEMTIFQQRFKRWNLKNTQLRTKLPPTQLPASQDILQVVVHANNEEEIPSSNSGLSGGISSSLLACTTT
jgi:hypothetical protein